MLPVRRTRLAAVGIAVLLRTVAGVHAQTIGEPGPPGPFAIDIRGATAGLPASTQFYPPIATTTSIPSRAFGGEAGAHVFPLAFRSLRVGVGASVTHVRGRATTPPPVAIDADEAGHEGDDVRASTSARAIATMTIVAPQVSLNFGTADGWSYVSGGPDIGRIETRATDVLGADGRRGGGWLRGFNVGGGARWFIARRLAFGFDVRIHRLGQGTADEDGVATPRTTFTSVAAGISIR